MRRTAPTRRSEGAARRVIAPGPASGVGALDDRPVQLLASRDGRFVLVALPYEVLVLDARDLSLIRTIEVRNPAPCVAEDLEGVLWIGGAHLYRGSLHGTRVDKVGARLGGFVDRIAVIRPGVLLGVGSQGEILLSIESTDDAVEARELHRHKSADQVVRGLVATPDERGAWIDGGPTAWLLDPAHVAGYGQLGFRQRGASDSEPAAPPAAITALCVTAKGRVALADDDGAVCWTQPDLTIAEQRFVGGPSGRSELQPLSIAGDARWLYVLRPRGLLHRFLVEAPPQTRRDPRRALPAAGRRPAPEPPALPLAQRCRLTRPAELLLPLRPARDLDPAEVGPGLGARLLLAASQADGFLGALWEEEVDALAWEELPVKSLGAETSGGQVSRAVANPTGPGAAPSFVAFRSKLEGPALSSIPVDDVIAGKSVWITTSTGSLLERVVVGRPLDGVGDVLGGDTIVLAAMLRMREGTARPGLLVWPGPRRAGEEGDPPIWLTWGDAPKGWLVLDTPSIRAQGWSRRDLFPMSIAALAPPAGLDAGRAPLPKRWFDAELHQALGKECKSALKVAW